MRRRRPDCGASALDATELASGLGSLLTARALECLTEDLAVYRQGLYLSAASLLGTASEATCYQVAVPLEAPSPKLAAAVARSATGGAQRVRNILRDKDNGARARSNALVAHASYLRALRSEGTRPSADQDPGQARTRSLGEAAGRTGLDFGPD